MLVGAEEEEGEETIVSESEEITRKSGSSINLFKVYYWIYVFVPCCLANTHAVQLWL